MNDEKHPDATEGVRPPEVVESAAEPWETRPDPARVEYEAIRQPTYRSCDALPPDEVRTSTMSEPGAGIPRPPGASWSRPAAAADAKAPTPAPQRTGEPVTAAPAEQREPELPARKDRPDNTESGGLLTLLDGPYTKKRFAAEFLIALVLLGLGVAALLLLA